MAPIAPSRTREGAWIEGRALLLAHRGPLMTGLGLVLVNRLAALVLPVSSKYAIDEVIGRGRLSLLLPIALAALAGVVVQSTAAFGFAYFTGLAAERAVARLRQELYSHVLHLPIRTFDTTPSGTLLSRLMTDAEQIRTVLGPGLVQLTSSLLTAGLALGVLLVLDVRLTLFVVTLLAAAAVALTRSFAWFRDAFLRVSVLQAAITSRTNEVLGNIRVVKAFAAERVETHAFARTSNRLLRTGVTSVRGMALLGGTQALVTGLGGVILLVVLLHNVAAGSMTVGDMALYVLTAGLLAAPLVHMTAISSELGRAFAALQRLHDLRQIPEEASAKEAVSTAPRIRGDVAFEDVSYAYERDRLALEHVTFQAHCGSLTALVGPNGSGKSTICRLLLGFDAPTQGRVLIDGQDLRTFRHRSYRMQLGVVLQDGWLLDGSVSDNIRYARPGAPRTEVYRAAQMAQCDEFVSRLPRGYDTQVGERGIWLSGGQRQRIAIARAILANPRILILDEFSSQLDHASETLVQSALKRLCDERTTFVVTHRLTGTRPDQVVELDRGRVVRCQTFESIAPPAGGTATQAADVPCGRDALSEWPIHAA